MKNLSDIVYRSWVYLIFCLGFTLLLSLYCILLSKSEGFLLINQYHSRILDVFFILFTNLGNGFFAIGLVAILLIRKKIGWSVQIAISFLVSGVAAQLFKHMIHSPRPMIFFGTHGIHWIYGITRTGYASFPSGHTATIFAITTLFSLYFPSHKTSILFFLIAALTGFSRIYLAEHFPVDVLGGLLTGVLISIAVYLIFPAAKFEKKMVETEVEPQSTNLQ